MKAFLTDNRLFLIRIILWLAWMGIVGFVFYMAFK